MVTAICPRLVIAGTGSGVGKTSLALGLTRELCRRGLRVQTFKVGPDFLDPTYLAMASGRTCYNLDGWMTSDEYVRGLFARATADADFGLVEGVMGLFDGASPRGLEGSTAEIAAWLDAPILLVSNAHGAARSMAATVKGFTEFEPDIRVSGVIANQIGSQRHRAWLADALDGATLPPLLGAIPRGALPSLPSRHLGLVTADHDHLAPPILEQLADACRQHIDIPRLLELAHSGVPHATLEQRKAVPHRPTSRLRLGIARDEAFHFYYPDNLESFEQAGATWVPFSPLSDSRLPADLDGLYFGGGYPEVYADRLAENRTMLGAIRDFAASGRCIYAECGGLMYLGRSLAAADGSRHSLAGVLPLDTAMLSKLKTLGYAEVSLLTDSLWGPAGQLCRGHEFHYSEITGNDGAVGGWQPAYSVQRRRCSEPTTEGLARGNVLASYVHLHWASRPDAVDHFLSRCGASS